MLARLQSFVKSAWSQKNSQRSCCLILGSQILALVTILVIGFIYVHVFLPNYNAKRLSKHLLVCSTVEDKWMKNELCELSWDKHHVTIGRFEQPQKLFEEDSHSAILLRSNDKSNSSVNGTNATQEAATERHYTWSSCGEFCSTSLVDEFGCRQLRVNARKMGSHLTLEGCTNIDVKECPFLDFNYQNIDPEADVKAIDKRTLQKKTVCSTSETEECLRQGIFKCVVGSEKVNKDHTTAIPLLSTTSMPEKDNNTNTSPRPEIANSSMASSTTTPTSAPLIKIKKALECTHMENLVSCNTAKLNKDSLKIFNCTDPASSECFSKPGTYVCDSESRCRKIYNPSSLCTRICHSIGLDDKNVVISDELFGHILTAKCEKAFRDDEKKKEVWPSGISHKTDEKWKNTPPILITCTNIHDLDKLKRNTTGSKAKLDLKLSDCFNGTRLENVTLPPFSTLKELQALWSMNLMTNDYNIDPIEMKDAPPTYNLTLHTFTPLYLNDFYKNQGEGCSSVISDEKFVKEKCPRFYEDYGRLPTVPKGQSVFPCFCRNVKSKDLNSTFCVVGNMKGVNVFEKDWEDAIVDFLMSNCIIILPFLAIFLFCTLSLICFLLYPLLMDWTPVNNLVLVGVTPSASVRQSPVNFVEDKRESIFTVSGHGPVGLLSPSPGVSRRDALQMEARRSRRSSIVSVM